jgi:hypothetical protein
MATSQSGRPSMVVAVRLLISSSVIALIAIMGLASSAMADAAPAFNFNYDGSYGTAGLSQPYSGTTTTGQSYGTGVAIQASDPKQKVYSLVEASANVGVGGNRGAFPASSRTIAPSSTTPSYLGPYYIVRRTSNGAIDTSFGDNGYVSAFPTSDNASYKFNSLCIDPGTGNIVVVGQEITSGSTEAVVERLKQPARGSGTATLDTSFNPSGTIPGVVTISTPNGNNAPNLYGCSVVDEGAGHSGAILVGGVDSSSSSSLVLAAKISSSGGWDTLFGTNGVVEYPVDSVNGSGTSAEITNISLSGAHSNFPDVMLSGFSFTKGTKDGASAQATALTVAIKDRTGALDTSFNGTGELVNPNYGEAVLTRVKSTHVGKNGGTASNLDIVYGTVGTDAAAIIDYPISGGVPDLTSPKTTNTGTFTVPADFASAQGYTFNSKGQILVSGDTSSDQETLTAIGGSNVLGY